MNSTIIWLSGASPLIPFVISLINYKRLEKKFQYFVYFLAFTVLVEIIATYLHYARQSNFMLYDFYVLIECLFLTWFLLSSYLKLPDRYVILIGAVYTVFWICSVWQHYPPSVLNQYIRSVEHIILIISAGYLLFQLSRNADVPLLKNSYFWISSAVFIYFTGSFSFFITSYYFSNDPVLFKKIWIYHSYLNIFFYILISFALSCCLKKKQ